MKILIISQYFWPESFRINDLAVGLQARGHEVSVLTGLPNYPAGRLFDRYGWRSCGKSEYQGLTIYRVPLLTRGQGKPWQLALNYFSFVLFSCLLGPFLCRGKYDVVFVFEPSPFTVGLPGVLFRYLKKVPLVFWVQDLWPESITATRAIKSKILLLLIRKMVHFIYTRCDCVLAQSEGFIQPAIAAGADPQRICYFPNWAETFYRPVSVDDDALERKEMPRGFCIMFAGNMGKAQSLETIIFAANILKDIEDINWVILGDGRQKDWMQKKITEYKLENKIHMLGRRLPEKMPYYFSLADALLITLRNDPIFALTIPSKLQSYLACGRPVLGSLDGEGAKIINESGAGLTSAAGDAGSLAKSVMKLYRLSEEERNQMGKKGREYYEIHFARERLISQLEKLMEDTVKERLCGS